MGHAHETADYSYDQRGRMIEAVYPDIKMRVQYGYDLAGRINGMSYPGGETVRYERDRAGRVTGVVDSVAGKTEMGYDLPGREVSQHWPNGLSETKTYDSASRLLAITPGQQDKKGPPTITYTYDQRGNRLTMDRSDVGLSTYTYDEISQLLTAALPDGDFQTYTFDAVGNRMSLKDSRGLQTYSYDEADELLEVKSDFNPDQPAMPGALMARLGLSDANSPIFKTIYGWDADGNQVSKTGPGRKVLSYAFDSLDRLVGISAPGSEPEQYRYNADMQRVATVRGKDSVSERFLHLGRGRQVLGDLDGQGKMTKRYILFPSGQLLAHVDTAANKPAFYHFDALGSTVVISNSSGMVALRFFFEPYGLRQSIPAVNERYGFVGRSGVQETLDGNLMMGGRVYSPEHGRFLSIDRLVVAGNTLDSDRYGYASNNPLLMIDPSGCNPFGAGIGAAAGAAVAAAAVAVVCEEWARTKSDGRIPSDDSEYREKTDAVKHCMASCCIAKYLGKKAADVGCGVNEWWHGKGKKGEQKDKDNNMIGTSLGLGNPESCSSSCVKLAGKSKEEGGLTIEEDPATK